MQGMVLFTALAALGVAPGVPTTATICDLAPPTGLPSDALPSFKRFREELAIRLLGTPYAVPRRDAVTMEVDPIYTRRFPRHCFIRVSPVYGYTSLHLPHDVQIWCLARDVAMTWCFDRDNGGEIGRLLADAEFRVSGPADADDIRILFAKLKNLRFELPHANTKMAPDQWRIGRENYGETSECFYEVNLDERGVVQCARFVSKSADFTDP